MALHLCSRSNLLSKQKSKIQWIKKGDRTTRFFHLTTLKHKSTNIIRSLKVANDMVVSEEDDINTEAINYFCQRGAIDDGVDDPFDLLGSIPMHVSLEENASMAQMIDIEEVRCTSFSFQGFKSLGPNGFPPTFFQVYWDIVRDDIFKAVCHFFRA